MFSLGAWLEASALINSNSLEEAGNYVANFLSKFSTINEQQLFVVGLSNRDYMKNAFNTELVLNQFKKKRQGIYLNTVGVTNKK